MVKTAVAAAKGGDMTAALLVLVPRPAAAGPFGSICRRSYPLSIWCGRWTAVAHAMGRGVLSAEEA